MANHSKFILVFALAFGIVPNAKGEPCPQDMADSFAKKTGLWSLSTPNEKAPANLRGFRATQLKTSAEVEINNLHAFVYVGRPTAPKKDYEGALAVKIGRLISADAPSTRSVSLRRALYSSICRPWYDFDVFWLPFSIGVDESVEQFARYHVTNRNVSSSIQKFHISYKSIKDDCIRSDSIIGQRRSGFLSTYEGEPLDPGREGLAWFGSQTATAGSVDTKVEHGIEKFIKEELAHLKKYSHLETQVTAYPIAKRVCVIFRPASQIPESSSVIEITDLDAERPRRQTWTIRWN